MYSVLHNGHLLEIKEATVDQPVISIDKIIFNTSDKNWVNRLYHSILKIKATKIGDGSKEIGYIEQPLVIGVYITPYHIKPELDVNYLIRFENTLPFPPQNVLLWEISFEIQGLDFFEYENIRIEYTNRLEVKSRINDWRSKISQLYSQINETLSKLGNCIVDKSGSKVILYEEKMQEFNLPPEELDTADVYFNNKLLFALKPRGLWIIGGNGRIDILTKNKIFYLINNADMFKEPDWYLYNNSETKPVKFNIIDFLRAISE